MVQMKACTLHPHYQILTYAVHSSSAILDIQLEGDQTLDRNCIWLCILRDHGLSFCNPCNTFQGQMNGAHSEPPDAHSRPRSEERRVGKECRAPWSPDSVTDNASATVGVVMW